MLDKMKIKVNWTRIADDSTPGAIISELSGKVAVSISSRMES